MKPSRKVGEEKIELVVFDWNGVIIADSAASLDADNEILKVFGGKPVGLKEWRDTIIIPSIDFYTQHGADRKILDAQPLKWAEVFHSFYEPRVAKVRTRQGLRRTLGWLKKRSIPCVILSNHTLSGIRIQLKRLKIERFFSEILANTEKDASLKKRTKLDRLKDYLRREKIIGKKILLIGDSPEEITIARKVGALSVAILHGYYAEWRLKQAKPDFIIGKLTDLQKIISK